MCGIAGFVSRDELADADIRRMTAALKHRGPDDEGYWFDRDTGVAFGHRRLSIIDLSENGCQPMQSPSGRFLMTYNGEIYNHAEIRDQLLGLGRTFRGHSDTEVLLSAIEQWGIDDALQSCVGMFAFAVLDRAHRILYLARDRLGEKPLYYSINSGTIIFASELRSLRQHPRFVSETDPDVVNIYLRLGYIPAPFSIYRSVRKVRPGTIVRVSLDDSYSFDRATEHAYWDADAIIARGIACPFRGDEIEAVEYLESLVQRSVSSQMIADVPVGAFLSGGIDSSTVVAIMQAISARPVHTFAIGFREDAYDEANFANAVARYLGTSHAELYVTAEEAARLIPALPIIYDEPFADASQIPTVLVSRLARGSVTVSLSGDGGDELFGGYKRYRLSGAAWSLLNNAPAVALRAASRILKSVRPAHLERAASLARWLFPNLLSARAVDQVNKLAELLGRDADENLYVRMISHWARAPLVVASDRPLSLHSDRSWSKLPKPLYRMMAFDLIAYLPDDILVKLDRASMSASLESRVPLLDHRIVEFAWSLPDVLKRRGRTTKWILRRLLQRFLPLSLVERPKMGFSVPMDQWLRGPLRDWAEALLDERSMKSEGLFNTALVRHFWWQHLSGQRNHQDALWTVLMYRAWQAAN